MLNSVEWKHIERWGLRNNTQIRPSMNAIIEQQIERTMQLSIPQAAKYHTTKPCPPGPAWACLLLRNLGPGHGTSTPSKIPKVRRHAQARPSLSEHKHRHAQSHDGRAWACQCLGGP